MQASKNQKELLATGEIGVSPQICTREESNAVLEWIKERTNIVRRWRGFFKKDGKCQVLCFFSVLCWYGGKLGMAEPPPYTLRGMKIGSRGEIQSLARQRYSFLAKRLSEE